MTRHRYCDGLPRRDFLQAGALGTVGLSLAGYLRAAQAGEVAAAPAKAGIFINLGGGPSHMDTFDLKPAASTEFRGELNPIATNVPGVEICELLPKLAQSADKFAILRGVSHTLAAHELGSKYLNTGSRPIPSLEYPGFGAVVSKERPTGGDLPSFVAIPDTPQRPGYLGVQHAALQTNGMPVPGKPFTVRGVSLGRGLTVSDVKKRQQLLADLDTALKDLDGDQGLVDGLDEFSEQAHEIITSPRARQAFDVSQEPEEVVSRFGAHSFGQSCLLAVRLIEAGVRFATVNFGGWDMHGDIFNNLRKGKAAQLDDGLAALFGTLAQRGLLDSTAVCVTGEFGRTPKINARSGRDHWPRAMCVLMAGGGIRTGQAIGASDDNGQGPAAEAISPDQVAASFYHALGIDHTREYHTATGRPVMIVRGGSPLPQLFG
ncbi:MAG: DUF1501 domain-containing protein [Pirellulales bacterium]